MNIFGKRGQLFWDLHFLVKVDATARIAFWFAAEATTRWKRLHLWK